MITWIDAGKKYDITSQLGIERNSLDLIMSIYETPTPNIIIVRKLDALSLRFGRKEGREKGRYEGDESIQIEEKEVKLSLLAEEMTVGVEYSKESTNNLKWLI